MVLIAGNCDYAIYDKGEFSDVIKLRIEREGDCPGPSIILRILTRGGQEGQSQRRQCDEESKGLERHGHELRHAASL